MSIDKTVKSNCFITIIILIVISNVFYSCSKKTEAVKRKPQTERLSLSQIDDSLRLWNKIAENRARIEDSIFLANECKIPIDTTNCFLARAYNDTLNKCDKWFINIWECKQAGRQPPEGELGSEGHDEGRAFIYKRQIERIGFVAIWDFDYKLYILKRTKRKN